MRAALFCFLGAFWVLDAGADNRAVITHGGVYSGSWESDDHAVAAVTIATGDIVEIAFSTIVSSGNGIYSTFPCSNLIVHDCHFIARNSMVYDVPNGFGILDNYMAGLQVYRNYFKGWRTAINCVAVGKAGASFAIENNQIRDCDGRHSDGAGWFLLNGNHDGNGGAIQVNSLDWLSFGDIGWNEVINTPGLSSPGDQISVYQSSGTPSQPITVHDNYVYGIFPADPSINAVATATGILTDGFGGSSYVNILDNIVVDFDGGGIGLAFGTFCVAQGNTVVSAGINPWTGQLYNGQQFLAGLSVYMGDTTNVIANNLAGVNQSQSAIAMGDPARNDTMETLWGVPYGWGTYSGNVSLPAGPITQNDEDDLASVWQSKTRAAGQQIGPD